VDGVVSAKWATWAGSVAHPIDRLLPGIGARLGRFPRVTALILEALQRVPTRRLRAVTYRSVTRPLVRRINAELVLRGVGGVRLAADLADVGGRGFASSGTWEWNVGTLIRRTLRAGDVFVDVGANTGYYTVLAAKVVGPTGHVYAIEPAPATAAALRRNVGLNGVADLVTVLEAAAGAEAGHATLYGRAAGHDMTSSLMRRPEDDGVTATDVAVLPIADVLKPSHRAAVRLVKLDVEGHEDTAILGLEPLFADGLRPLVVVEVHANFNPSAAPAIERFAARHELAGDLLVDDQLDLAPRDRRLSLRPLGCPPELGRAGTDRYNLLLRPSDAEP
jgi:FkbM family methyltransferase